MEFQENIKSKKDPYDGLARKKKVPDKTSCTFWVDAEGVEHHRDGTFRGFVNPDELRYLTEQYKHLKHESK